MAIPTSQLFDLLDWNSRHTDTSDSGDRSILDASDGAFQDGLTSDGLTIVRNAFAAQGGILLRANTTLRGTLSAFAATYRTPLATPQVYTFE